MKTTIKLTASKSLEIHPCTKTGGFILEFVEGMEFKTREAHHLTPDQWGVLMFAGEVAHDQKTPCGKVSDGIACQEPRAGIEKLCPDCNPWRPGFESYRAKYDAKTAAPALV